MKSVFQFVRPSSLARLTVLDTTGVWPSPPMGCRKLQVSACTVVAEASARVRAAAEPPTRDCRRCLLDDWITAKESCTAGLNVFAIERRSRSRGGLLSADTARLAALCAFRPEILMGPGKVDEIPCCCPMSGMKQRRSSTRTTPQLRLPAAASLAAALAAALGGSLVAGPALAQTQIWQRASAPPPAGSKVVPENCRTGSDGSSPAAPVWRGMKGAGRQLRVSNSSRTEPAPHSVFSLR